MSTPIAIPVRPVPEVPVWRILRVLLPIPKGNLDPALSVVRLQPGAFRITASPFGGGVRKCIGEPFAQHWSMRLAPDAKVALDPKITLRPRHGLPMVLQARQPLSQAPDGLCAPKTEPETS